MGKVYYCRQRDRQGLFPYVNKCTGVMQLMCKSRCNIPSYCKEHIVKERPKLTIHNRDGSDTIVEPLKSCPGWEGKEES